MFDFQSVLNDSGSLAELVESKTLWIGDQIQERVTY